ncbi:helix-hairpin-helix domain-containing protein, partial [Candidatus Fermentibacteria bacterium]|nr:helix-hairpin-helix domain-containing protein [Candidatus Fermentibacteria bacterium]
ADAIMSWREQNGPFERVEDLLEIPGIGPSMLPALEEYLVIE